MTVDSMTVPIVWVAGLIAIGISFHLIAKSIQIRTTADSGTVKTIAYWGVAAIFFWIIYGFIIVNTLM